MLRLIRATCVMFRDKSCQVQEMRIDAAPDQGNMSRDWGYEEGQSNKDSGIPVSLTVIPLPS